MKQVGQPLRGRNSHVSVHCDTMKGAEDVSSRPSDKTRGRWSSQLVHKLAIHSMDMKVSRSVALTIDASVIVSGFLNKTILRCDAQSGTRIRENLCGHKSDVFCVAVSVDGKVSVRVF